MKIYLSENINIIKGIKIVLYILLGIVVGNAVDFIVVKSIAAILVVLNIVGQFVDINLFKSIIYSKKNLENKEDVKTNEYNKLAETLYDNEIAEYYVYDEIKTIEESAEYYVYDEIKTIEESAFFSNVAEHMSLVVFTDIVDEEGLMRFNEKCSRMLNYFEQGNDVQVLLIPFNDYEMFTVQMDNLIR